MINILKSMLIVLFCFLATDWATAKTYLAERSKTNSTMRVVRSYPEIGYVKIEVKEDVILEEDQGLELDRPLHTYATDYSPWWMSTPTSFGINARKAHSITKGKGVVVAVIDTGADLRHEALRGNLWVNPKEIPGNYIDDDGNGYIDDVQGYSFSGRSNYPADDNGHGTHVSGIVLMAAPDVTIMPLKFIGANGSGSTSDAVEAVLYAAKNGAKVINASWGGSMPSDALQKAIEFANGKGVVFVAAAGNESQNNDWYGSYPANYKVPNVISVASHDYRGQRSSFSNYGNAVHVSAPGSNIKSAYLANSYASLSGTSMASPFVAGAAALIVAYKKGLEPSAVKSMLNPGMTTIKLDASFPLQCR